MDDNEDPFGDLEDILAAGSRAPDQSGPLTLGQQQLINKPTAGQPRQLDTLSEVSEELSLSWRDDASSVDPNSRLKSLEAEEGSYRGQATDELSASASGQQLFNLASELPSPSIESSSSEKRPTIEPENSKASVEHSAAELAPNQKIESGSVESLEEPEPERPIDSSRAEPTQGPHVQELDVDHEPRLLELIDSRLSTLAASLVNEMRALDDRRQVSSQATLPATTNKVETGCQFSEVSYEESNSPEEQQQKSDENHSPIDREEESVKVCRCNKRDESVNQPLESAASQEKEQPAIELDEYQRLLDYYEFRSRKYIESTLLQSMIFDLADEIHLEPDKTQKNQPKSPGQRSADPFIELDSDHCAKQIEDKHLKNLNEPNNRRYSTRVQHFGQLRRKSIELLGAIQRAAAQLEINRRKFELDRLHLATGKTSIERNKRDYKD